MTSTTDLLKKCYGENYPHNCPHASPVPHHVYGGCRMMERCMRINKEKRNG